MDTLKSKCYGCNRILSSRESCPTCAERKRAEMHARGVASSEPLVCKHKRWNEFTSTCVHCGAAQVDVCVPRRGDGLEFEMLQSTPHTTFAPGDRVKVVATNVTASGKVGVVQAVSDLPDAPPRPYFCFFADTGWSGYFAGHELALVRDEPAFQEPPPNTFAERFEAQQKRALDSLGYAAGPSRELVAESMEDGVKRAAEARGLTARREGNAFVLTPASPKMSFGADYNRLLKPRPTDSFAMPFADAGPQPALETFKTPEELKAAYGDDFGLSERAERAVAGPVSFTNRPACDDTQDVAKQLAAHDQQRRIARVQQALKALGCRVYQSFSGSGHSVRATRGEWTFESDGFGADAWERLEAVVMSHREPEQEANPFADDCRVDALAAGWQPCGRCKTCVEGGARSWQRITLIERDVSDPHAWRLFFASGGGFALVHERMLLPFKRLGWGDVVGCEALVDRDDGVREIRRPK